jgi:hypothetical protein
VLVGAVRPADAAVLLADRGGDGHVPPKLDA